MKSIVVAADFSPNSTHASHRAALIARATGAARLELLHVLPAATRWTRWIGRPADTTARFEHAGRKLRSLEDALRPAATAVVEARVVAGDRIEELAGATDGADLLVIGAPARPSLLPPLLGETRRLLRKARSPVLVVRTPPKVHYRSVLVAVDLAPASDEAFGRARAVAPGARFGLVHAYRAPLEGKLEYAGVAADAIDAHRTEALLSAVFGMANLLRSQTALPSPTAHVVHGHAALALMAKEREIGADLVVVSPPAKTFIEEWLVPSVTSRLIEEGSADVLVVQTRGRR